jgi:hypothetical protein
MENPTSAELMTQAYELLVTALALIDEVGDPAVVGPHIDLARERLSRNLASVRECSSNVWEVVPKPAA